MSGLASGGEWVAWQSQQARRGIPRWPQAVRSWYVTLGDPLAHGTPVPPPQAVDPRNHSRLMHEVRDSIASDGTAALYEALLALWA
ncbi:MAG: hypothetical protein ACRDNT_13190, partial [Streptosporangiaceae bacterium]